MAHSDGEVEAVNDSQGGALSATGQVKSSQIRRSGLVAIRSIKSDNDRAGTGDRR
jgi:hypothetical protein